MASKTAAYQGVDLSSIPRHNLYATPRTPTSSSYAGAPRSPARLSTAYSATASSRSKNTTTASPYSHSSSHATGSGAGHASNAGRKRSRTSQSPTKRPSPLAPVTTLATPRTTAAPGDRSAFSPVRSSSVLRSEYQTPGFVSPAPLANSQYSLAQGVDTPTAAQADAYERPAFSAEAERTRLFSRLRDDELDRPTYANGLDGARDVAGPLARGRNGNGQDEAGQNGFWGGEDATAAAMHFQNRDRDQRWSVRRALYDTVTGVAGVVFHFCTAGAFRGFTAGGGQGWAFGAGDDGVARPALLSSRNERSHLSMEDSWQDMDFVQDQEMPSAVFDPHIPKSASARSSPAGTPRAAKKIKSSYGDDGGLRNNWILVGEDETPSSGSRPGSPASSTTASPAGLRRASMIATPTNRRRRFTATMSMPVNGTGGFSSTKQASSAALRSPRIRRELNASPVRDAQRPRAGSTRTSAIGVAGSFGNTNGAGAGLAKSIELNTAPQSPIAKDTERLLRIKAKREREEDREILRMNQRLEEMIRQGREALHTRYEVEELDESGDDPMLR